MANICDMNLYIVAATGDDMKSLLVTMAANFEKVTNQDLLANVSELADWRTCANAMASGSDNYNKLCFLSGDPDSRSEYGSFSSSIASGKPCVRVCMGLKWGPSFQVESFCSGLDDSKYGFACINGGEYMCAMGDEIAYIQWGVPFGSPYDGGYEYDEYIAQMTDVFSKTPMTLHEIALRELFSHEDVGSFFWEHSNDYDEDGEGGDAGDDPLFRGYVKQEPDEMPEYEADVPAEPRDDAQGEATEVPAQPEDAAVDAQQEDLRIDSLSEGQKRYLAAIVSLAAEGGAVRSTDVADKLGVSKASVSRTLDSLEGAGLVVRSKEGIRLVPAGIDPEDLKPADEYADAFPHLEDVSASQRKYLATIAALAEEGETVRAVDIAAKLDVSKASVSKALGGLEEAGLVQRDGRDIRLTALAMGGGEDGDVDAADERPDVPETDADYEAGDSADNAVDALEVTDESEDAAGGWTFSAHQRAIGRRFSVEVPDQWVLTPDEGGRPLARYELGVEDKSECPQIICSTMAGDLDEEMQTALRESVIPEARIQLSRYTFYSNDMANTLSRSVNDWVVEGKNCQVQVFEILIPSIFPGFTSDSYEYHVKPVAYDHEDFLRLADSWSHLEEGQLKELAFAIAATIELDKPVELKCVADLDRYRDEPADTDAFCELVGTISNMLNLSGSERMNANLWREIRHSNNDKGCLLVVDTMPRIQAEAYNASLNDEVAYYGRLVTALERQHELGVAGFEKMWKLVGEFGDVRVADHVTMEDDEEAAKAVNSLGIISIPAGYQALQERWETLDPSVAVSEAREAAGQPVDEAARLQEEERAARKAEAEARLRAEMEAARKAEEEARHKAEAEAARKAEEAERLATVEAARKAEEAARLAAAEAARKAEAEARQRVQEAEVDLLSAREKLNGLTVEDDQLEAQMRGFDRQIRELGETVRELKGVEGDLASARKELDGLGFFAFGKKGELRKKIQQLEQTQKELSEKLPAEADETIKTLERQRDEAADALAEVKRKAAECQERIDAAAAIVAETEV